MMAPRMLRSASRFWGRGRSRVVWVDMSSLSLRPDQFRTTARSTQGRFSPRKFTFVIQCGEDCAHRERERQRVRLWEFGKLVQKCERTNSRVSTGTEAPQNASSPAEAGLLNKSETLVACGRLFFARDDKLERGGDAAEQL